MSVATPGWGESRLGPKSVPENGPENWNENTAEKWTENGSKSFVGKFLGG
jgi:hypothetical protein